MRLQSKGVDHMYEALYEQNKGLVNMLARQYAPLCELDRAVSVEDLAQAGFFALVRAEASYDPDAGRSWAAWAAWNIRCEFNNLLGLRHGHFTRAHTGAVSLDRPVEEDGCALSELIVDESLPDTDAALLLDETRRCVREAVARLKDAGQRQAIRLRALEGRGCRETAALMGTSPARARRLYAQGGVSLARDPRLRAQLCLDERTRFHAHKGVQAFNRDWTSVTEGAALWRVEQREREQGQGNRQQE